MKTAVYLAITVAFDAFMVRPNHRYTASSGLLNLVTYTVIPMLYCLELQHRGRHSYYCRLSCGYR